MGLINESKYFKIERVINMFDYKEFKRVMKSRGHRVWKHGNYIEIEPFHSYQMIPYLDNNAYNVVQGFEDSLRFVSMNHFNSWIYFVRFKIV